MHTGPFQTAIQWHSERPHVLVVACSDGRLQNALDAYLRVAQGIEAYDRVYLPGGPGALASSGFEFARAERHLEEFRFLLDAHDVQEVILIFHGPSPNGPAEACCADYLRHYGNASPDRIREEQMKDAREVLSKAFHARKPKVQVIYCQVEEDLRVSFVPIHLSAS